MEKGASAPSTFLSYNQWPCQGSPCPNVTGDTRGDIEVQWQTSKVQCAPRLMSDGAATPNGVIFGLELLKNVTVGCSEHQSLKSDDDDTIREVLRPPALHRLPTGTTSHG